MQGCVRSWFRPSWQHVLFGGVGYGVSEGRVVLRQLGVWMEDSEMFCGVRVSFF